MRFFAGLLVLITGLSLLPGCDRSNKVFPTADNLKEVDSERLKIFEAMDTESGVLIVIGESASRRCEIQVFGTSMISGVAVNSIEDKDKIHAVCKWDSETYTQSKNSYDNIAVRLDHKATIDLLLFNGPNEKYLGLTGINKDLPQNN
ncbi:hypothetical protein [Microbulbifer sp. SSSA005]|uniref:hypothetical protein n=1 Tax=Microbulbifer sp. SSSA005 TaxID=3243378 RepID=UPI0040394907